ncbi:methionine adenosyltransferase domain-containing protein [Streptomyces alkaliphilus]|uniref:methionine adenosyltransferase domain-containing protein n=1 Tax=Streptomyces alkaliphilus TaxID=1472722 RepID=UPI001E56E3FE|nr:methionine adenosyltransferase domain-containing protein [Streptomyces alkaliphilus]
MWSPAVDRHAGRGHRLRGPGGGHRRREVDRSAAYAMRWGAKNIVAAGSVQSPAARGRFGVRDRVTAGAVESSVSPKMTSRGPQVWWRSDTRGTLTQQSGHLEHVRSERGGPAPDRSGQASPTGYRHLPGARPAGTPWRMGEQRWDSEDERRSRALPGA